MGDGLDMWNVSSLMIGCQHADIVVESVQGRGRGRPRKTWRECVEEDQGAICRGGKGGSSPSLHATIPLLEWLKFIIPSHYSDLPPTLVVGLAAASPSLVSTTNRTLRIMARATV